MNIEDLKITDEFIPDWILGIKDSMQLDSDQEVCSITVEYKNKKIEARVLVVGEVKVIYNDDMYKASSQFPQELLDYFAGKRPELEDEVEVENNNWFELIVNDVLDNGAAGKEYYEDFVDDFEDFTTVDDVRQWLLDAVTELSLDQN